MVKELTARNNYRLIKKPRVISKGKLSSSEKQILDKHLLVTRKGLFGNIVTITKPVD